MSPTLLLVAYCAALVVFSIAGGDLPRRIEMTHTRTQLAMSLVSGLMLGIAFFHLLPHSVLTLGVDLGLNVAMGWVVFGLVSMLLLLRLLHFHQPDYPADPAVCDHHDHAHHDHSPAGQTGYPAAHEQQTAEHATGFVSPDVNWRGVLVGLTFHTFIDGVALGAAFLATPHGHSEQLLGFGVFLAILLHKPLDAMSITSLMKAGGASAVAQTRANVMFALVCPLGALLFYLYSVSLGDVSANLVALALAFSAGAFICIALSDLLPEVQFHSHDRVKLTAIFILGIAVSYLLATASPEHSHAVTAVIHPF
ncbi:MAG: ZIP family metal transporter [Congregibacter sp.]